MGKKGKTYPAHQIARKKILDDQKSPTHPPQELNVRPVTECHCTNAWWFQGERSQQEEKTVVKNSSGVLIKFYWGQKRYLLRIMALPLRYSGRNNGMVVWRGSTVHQCKSRGGGEGEVGSAGILIVQSDHALTHRSLVSIQKRLPSSVPWGKSMLLEKVRSFHLFLIPIIRDFKLSSKQMMSILWKFLSSSSHLLVKLDWNRITGHWSDM